MGGRGQSSMASNMVTSYASGKPELVPRYTKGYNGSKLQNTYTTKQFAPYVGDVLSAGVMTYESGKPNQQTFKIADIHSGIYGAYLQSQNDGSGFAVNVFKDEQGWYMQHSRLGHFANDDEYTDKIYLKELSESRRK